MWSILTPNDALLFEAFCFRHNMSTLQLLVKAVRNYLSCCISPFSFTHTHPPLICCSSKPWKPIVEKYPQFCGHCPALTFNSSRSSCLLDYRVLSGGERWIWQVFSCQVERVKVEQSVRPIGMQDCSLLGDRIIALYGPWRRIWIIWRQRSYNLKGNGTKATCFFILLPEYQVCCTCNADDLINS